MFERNHLYIKVLSALLLLTGACAKISAPTGGPRDRIPPKIVTSAPLNGTKNFKGKEIQIEFDEFIVLDNISEKFMVSPPMKKKPRVFTRGKSIRVQFDEPLRDSITYTLYFMDAIKDLNEGNVLGNYKFVFSTGSVIDSLSVTGNVYTSPDLEAPEKTTALLFSNIADSAVQKGMPDYLSRVDIMGYFRIDNIRPGKYKLYALKDDDNSRNYNRVEEAFAFMDSLVIVTPGKNFIPVQPDTAKKIEPKSPVKPATTRTTTKSPVTVAELVPLKGNHKLILFEGTRRSHYLAKSTRDSRYHLTYVLSLPPDSMNFDFSIEDATPDNYFVETTPFRDTINVWITDSSVFSRDLISTLFRYPFTDTLGNNGYKQDTIPMRFTATRAPRGKVAKPKLDLKNYPGTSLKPGQTLVFESLTPLKDPDTTRIKLFEILEKERKKMPFELTSNKHRVVLKASLNEGKSYLFIADSAAFSDIYELATDSIGIRFAVREAASFSKVTFKITNLGGNGIVQLFDNSEKLIEQRTVSNDGPLTFPLVDPGKYRARIIFDMNNDGKWTTGDFFSKRQPEPVSYYPDVLEIKEGWDVTQPWDVSVRNVKDQKLRKKPNQR